MKYTSAPQTTWTATRAPAAIRAAALQAPPRRPELRGEADVEAERRVRGPRALADEPVEDRVDGVPVPQGVLQPLRRREDEAGAERGERAGPGGPDRAPLAPA